MKVSDQKVLVRCVIQRVLRAGVRDKQEDRARAIQEIRDTIIAAGIPVFSSSAVYFPDYRGFGPMWYGEALVILDGQLQHFEVLIKAA